jgi:hypothetical protein
MPLRIWSNDVLWTLIADGFESQQHAAAFLWLAKDSRGRARPRFREAVKRRPRPGG